MMNLPMLAVSGNGTDMVFMGVMIVAIVAMWIFMGRKQSKDQKQHEVMVASIEVGDSVLTTSGFYGVITDVSDDVVIVEFGNNKNCRIPMKKEYVAEVEKAN